uniref:Thioredoxin domain-containing protein n=1 Tax=Euplotes crassus TaxID=5936 RepID=A0A7S3NQN2_EUPCR|mmetsp:Transcript_11165/g.11126  ORF Transcript_11165/g.11126 Transcript_11165/m.11126 type:complete len:346 (+) Transcript_11165:278-1315(+)
MLKNVQKWLEDNPYKKEIPIVRVDYSTHKDAVYKEEITPSKGAIVKLYHGKYYDYEENFQAHLFLHFINRHLYPIVLLKSKEDIDKFTNTTLEWEENTPFPSQPIPDYFKNYQMVTRVVAFVKDKSDLKSELQDLKEAALDSAIRNDLRVAKVTKKSLVDYYKKKMGDLWFDEYSHNSIVLFSNTENTRDTRYYNLDADNIPILEFLCKRSMAPVPKLNAFVQRIHTVLKKPLFIAFVDFNDIHSADQSRDLIKTLRILEDTLKYVVFGRIEDNESHTQRKRDIGITWDGLPTLAYSNSGLGNQCVFPQTHPLTLDNIHDFVKACLTGKFRSNFEFRDTFENTKK